MQIDFLFRENVASDRDADALQVGDRLVPIEYVRNRRARHYILRLKDDGSARMTIPWGGTEREARKFAESRTDWLQEQLELPQEDAIHPREWSPGDEIMFRGEMFQLREANNTTRRTIKLNDQLIPVRRNTSNLRPFIEKHLWGLAKQELPIRTYELAEEHELHVRRITIRNQRGRWGSCSANQTLSLNWRLVQTPPDVRDYVLIHELMHLRELNHSKRYWRLVEAACPKYRVAEHWLKNHAGLLKQA